MTAALPAFNNFKFGCDPELFIMDDNGTFVCADGLIPGTKEEPFKVNCGAVQVDGMAAEFNTDPASSFEEFDNNVVTVMGELKKFLPKGYKLVATPSVEFSQEEWDKAPEHAKVLGCSPDYNAWTGSTNPPPVDVTKPTLRTASGHLHLGWRDGGDPNQEKHIKHCQDLVKQLDWYLGAWSLRKDPDPVRRRLYGKAGALRYKPYGVEYRVLSNFWVMSKVDRREVWNRMQRALMDMSKKFLPDTPGGQAYKNALIYSIDNSVRDSYLERQFRFPVQRI